MLKLNANELRTKYLKFFESKGHKIIPSFSLIPENDPTVLFTTAGMHPLVPYLMGERHPEGTRLCDVQKCVRTGDIDEVGDNSHCTFFEMLGNWSLGDYFKNESIAWSYEFLTQVLGIDKNNLAITVFEGDEDAPRDEESAKIWEEQGISKDRIFYRPKKDNWWGPAGQTGPCGPDTEIFIDNGQPKCCEDCNPSCDCGKYLEIWNNVFMQYNKTIEGNFEPLKKFNVDTGMGLERTVCILNGKDNVYETDVFTDAIKLIQELSDGNYENEEDKRAIRIIADHIRTATMILGDGIVPSNVDQGYVLRRLIRRSVRFGRNINMQEKSLEKIAKLYIDIYADTYSELKDGEATILKELNLEEERFNKTLEQGIKEFEKVMKYLKGNVMNGKTAFRLYDTFGFPIEITQELAQEKGLTINMEEYHQAFKKHQEKSQAGAQQKFKGGLQDNSEATTNLHTATHILHSALIKTLGGEIKQRGSNITADRLRFDFEFSRKMTAEEKQVVEDLVNEVINQGLEIRCDEMTVDEAYDQGAIGVFKSKYGEKVKVYSIGDFSKEICGGPHAKNSKDIGRFKIKKEQSSSAGVRRIKAVLIKD